VSNVTAEVNPPNNDGTGKDHTETDNIWTTNGSWTIESTDTDIEYSNRTILCNGNLTIQSSGKLTLDNVTLWMNYTNDDEIPTIFVYPDGTLIIKNNSTVTNYPGVYGYPGNPDRYNFTVQGGVPGGSLTIQSSTVENMGDKPDIKDGIQCYSSSVTISNSTIRNNYGNGIYMNADGISITGNNIYNNLYGLRILNSDYNIISDNKNISDNQNGIYMQSSNYNTITNNSIDNNQYYGIYLHTCNGNDLLNNIIKSNSDFGIRLLILECTPKIGHSNKL
jgi:hypothetical protein